MKVLIIGGTGTIGQAVAKELGKRHDVLIGAFSLGRGHVRVDMENPESIKAMYESIGKLDAVISTAGKVHFEDLKSMDADKYNIGLHNKLMGQVNLVLEGRTYLNEGGSFTLTSGILNQDPIPQGSSAAMVNGALDAFVKAAALELDCGRRINCISPTVITEAMDAYAPFFRGYKPVDAAEAALAYAKSVEGLQTGQVFKVGY